MSFTEKIDVLELLIKVLEQHEKRLDEIVFRFEAVAATLAQEAQT